jgi:hypothetical protein
MRETTVGRSSDIWRGGGLTVVCVALGWRNRDKTWRNGDLRMLYTSLINFPAEIGINPNFLA